MGTLKKVYLSWEGRISRKTYWIFSIPIALPVLISEYLINPVNENLSFILILIVIFPAMMINIKRSHDRGRTGWFTILLIVPIISLWPLIEFGFLKGSDGSNKFGEPDRIWDT